MLVSRILKCYFIGLGMLLTMAQAPIQSAAIVSGELKKWHPVTVDLTGPTAAETDDNPNPFLDYRLQVTFTGPSNQTYIVPGFFAGDGKGGGSGNVWRVRFSPDEAGHWTYTASFRSGEDVAVDLTPSVGVSASFDGESGSFTVAEGDPNAPGFLKWGRLEYVGEHYLKFRDGAYWIKGGTDSPENFLGYAGFDSTVDQGNLPNDGAGPFLHEYAAHIGDWSNGDPDWGNEAGKGIIGALNYLASKQVNSVYFLPMNLGGDGQDTYPFVAPEKTVFNKTHHDISKLYQWNMVFDHAQRQGIKLHFVLAETETDNENWLDDGALDTERKLYFRELIARFSYILAIKWNLSEENDFSIARLEAFANYIQVLDPYDHPITIHTDPNDFSDYEAIKGDPRFSATSIQYNPDSAGNYVEIWRENSTMAGRPWIIDLDENNPADTGLTDSNAEDLRKRVLYDVYFSGGNIEWYGGYHPRPPTEIGGDITKEDFRTREDMWNYMWYARKFMQQNLPFWAMAPQDGLLSGESGSFGGGEIFARRGVYAIYLPDASPSGNLDLSAESNTDIFQKLWYNPRTGQFEGNLATVTGGESIALGSPPSDSDEDWVVLIRKPPVYLPLVVKN